MDLLLAYLQLQRYFEERNEEMLAMSDFQESLLQHDPGHHLENQKIL